MRRARLISTVIRLMITPIRISLRRLNLYCRTIWSTLTNRRYVLGRLNFGVIRGEAQQADIIRNRALFNLSQRQAVEDRRLLAVEDKLRARAEGRRPVLGEDKLRAQAVQQRQLVGHRIPWIL